MSAKTTFRIGQIVPSSNVTMETEIPAMFNRRQTVAPERFTFHSARMRMKEVTPEQLLSMDNDSDRCAAELSDAEVDVIGYACLVAIMAREFGYHCKSQDRLGEVAAENGSPAPIISSAGALIDSLHTMGAAKVAVIAPYMQPLTDKVVAYIENEGIQVTDSLALEIADNLEVGARDPLALVELARQVDHSDADVLVLSACVQMPSLEAIQIVQDEIGKPVVSAATATVYQMLKALDLDTLVPDAGELLSGKY
ncbi:maleate cis-trans isomerase family protein [Ornithinimicrobium sufpigmenti]|uniref:maleate cis-trans isomerase family protein n=1 Tax=Ornithinimicrobium sufpigmenti TaxID=2508882 RepID=UPI00103664A7|nr:MULTISPECIES: aspartate/glutamate racemase family protein [unclassified Ornithinimicrobium]